MSKKITELLERLIPQLTDLLVIADADESKNYKVSIETLVESLAHNLLASIQGGTTTQRYHLSLYEYTKLRESLGVLQLPFFVSSGIQDNIEGVGSLTFFLSSGTQDDISYAVGDTLPFFISSSVQDNIALI